MQKIILTIVLAALCLNFWSSAQEKPATVAPLKVGDKLPEAFWQQEHQIYQNGKTTTQTLAQYKGKLIILDFWAIWCSTCIKKMPLLDSMQLEHSKQFAVMLVTRDSVQKLPAVMQKNGSSIEALKLNTVYNDTYLNYLFPHRYIPHYIWINPKGSIFAITGFDFLTKNNVEQLIEKIELKADKQTSKP